MKTQLSQKGPQGLGSARRNCLGELAVGASKRNPSHRGTNGWKWVSTFTTLLVLFALSVPPAHAQVYSASLTGVITDPSGAVVPNAHVTMTDVNKGFIYQASTNSVGIYRFPTLSPSPYRLTVTAPGFETYVQSGITLVVNQHATVNVRLRLGATRTAVSVQGAAPLLSTQDATTGQNVNRTLINDLPLVGRSVYDLTFLAAGINPAPGAPFGTPHIGNNFTSNGGRNATADITIDGVSSTSYEQNTAILNPLYAPSVDAVQEYTVEQNNFSADKGFSGNTIINVVMRSGTNNFHGSVYEFVRNSAFDANNWFNDANNIAIPGLRWNDFGATVGGPIKKDKIFFFVDYEGTRSRTLSTSNAGVPSAAERLGDFSELCGYSGGAFNAQGMCSSPGGQLWDPYSGVYDPSQGGPVRSSSIPFNNMAAYMSPGSPILNGTPYQPPAVPGNLINPVSQKMMNYYPLPNVGVGAATYNYLNNWAGSGTNINTNDQGDVKIDAQFSPTTMLSGRFSMGHSFYEGAYCWHNPLDPCTQGPTPGGPIGGSLNFTRTLSPQTVLTASYGVTRSWTDAQGIDADFPHFNPITTLGLPSYLGASGISASPVVEISNYQFASGQSLGAQAWSVLHYGLMTHDLLASLDHMQGRHEFKFGGEYRKDFINFLQPGTPGGIYIYNPYTTSQDPFSGGGDSMASFLTGLGGPGSWGQYEVPLAMSSASSQFAGYFQDNWRTTDKLTLNLGVRYDLFVPRTERYNRQSWFDPNANSPLVVPGLPQLKGGLVFANSSNRRTFNTNYDNWAPRFGFAYKTFKNTVVRGGYGIFYDPPNYMASGTGPGGFVGFDQTTGWLTSYQGNGVTPYAPISNPWPSGIIMPPGNKLGLLTNVGVSVQAPIRTWNQTPYTQTWSLGFQHELPGNILVDANYVGTKGTHLYYLGAGSLQYFGSWIEHASSSEITNLLTFVPNPFYGSITTPGSSLTGPTVQDTQLNLPFNQFTGVSGLSPPWANSIYHALQLKVEKRFSHGLQFLSTYTISKSIDDASVGENTTWLGGTENNIRDPNDLKLERGLSEYDIPQNLMLSYVYQLPFGRGKHWGSGWNRWADAVLGGWQTNGIWRFASGFPIFMSLSGGAPLPTYPSQAPNLLAPLRKNNCNESCMLNQYFANPQAAAVPAQFTLGTAPRDLPNVRAPGTDTAALSLFKEFPITSLREGAHLEFRAESFNALNHPQFCAPDAQVNGGTFGQITCQENSPREVQLGVKLYW